MCLPRPGCAVAINLVAVLPDRSAPLAAALQVCAMASAPHVQYMPAFPGNSLSRKRTIC